MSDTPMDTLAEITAAVRLVRGDHASGSDSANGPSRPATEGGKASGLGVAQDAAQGVLRGSGVTAHEEGADLPTSSSLPWGVEEIDGYPVPPAYQFDPEFLDLGKTRHGRELQKLILREIQSGKIQVKLPSLMEETERRPMRLYTGQWGKLLELEAQCGAPPGDKKHRLRANHFLAEIVNLGLELLVPRLGDLNEITTPGDLRRALIEAWRQAARDEVAHDSLSEVGDIR